LTIVLTENISFRSVGWGSEETGERKSFIPWDCEVLGHRESGDLGNGVLLLFSGVKTNMPIYHSTLNGAQGQKVCNTMVLPLRTKIKGPAPPAPASGKDIIDEAIQFFRANVLFRNYESQGPADLTLCYLTIFISEVLREFAAQKKKKDAIAKITTLSMSQNFTIPGDKGFPLSGFFTAPTNRTEGDIFRQYYRQLREELVNRLVEIAYNAEGDQNKWWMQFSKRKFMNIAKT